MHFLGLARFRRIIRSIRSLRVARCAAGFELLVVVRAIPVTGPLPHVARHIVESISVGRKLRHRSKSDVAVFAGIFVREMPLVSVSHPFAIGTKVIAPDIRPAGKSATSRKLPLSFRRQTFAGPLCVRLSVFIRDVDDRVVSLARDVALWSQWMPPVSAGNICPPLKVVIESDGMIRRSKNNRTCNQVF